MDKRIALLIIYNHRFDKNIPVLDELFKGRFSNVYHVVPFYDGKKENVLPVYESSYYFSGYIAQALNQIRDKSFTHYVFTSDDLMLNPAIDENNFHSMIGLNEDDCYIPRFRSLSDIKWARSLDALGYGLTGLGAEVNKMLPLKEKAIEHFKEHGLHNFEGVPARIARKIVLNHLFNYYNWYQPSLYLLRVLKYLFKRPFSFYNYNYPQIGGYNDFFIVPSYCISSFAHYCGAFAATKMFVEIAIPTSMVLCSKSIKTGKDTKMKCGDLWSDEIKKFEEKYEYSLDSLYKDFPEDLLYYHPVKLSKWK